MASVRLGLGSRPPRRVTGSLSALCSMTAKWSCWGAAYTRQCSLCSETGHWPQSARPRTWQGSVAGLERAEGQRTREYGRQPCCGEKEEATDAGRGEQWGENLKGGGTDRRRPLAEVLQSLMGPRSWFLGSAPHPASRSPGPTEVTAQKPLAPVASALSSAAVPRPPVSPGQAAAAAAPAAFPWPAAARAAEGKAPRPPPPSRGIREGSGVDPLGERRHELSRTGCGGESAALQARQESRG